MAGTGVPLRPERVFHFAGIRTSRVPWLASDAAGVVLSLATALSLVGAQDGHAAEPLPGAGCSADGGWRLGAVLLGAEAGGACEGGEHAYGTLTPLVCIQAYRGKMAR